MEKLIDNSYEDEEFYVWKIKKGDELVRYIITRGYQEIAVEYHLDYGEYIDVCHTLKGELEMPTEIIL